MFLKTSGRLVRTDIIEERIMYTMLSNGRVVRAVDAKR